MNQILKSLRSFRRNPMLLFVNLPGLAIALATFLLLMVYVKHELSFDEHIKTKHRVVRLVNRIVEENSNSVMPICMRKAYTDIPPQVPEIIKASQIYRGWEHTLKAGDKQFSVENVLFVDPEFSEVFGLDYIDGNAKDALVGKNNVVITTELALKTFGNTQCSGQYIELNETKYVVGGVVEKWPQTSHIQFDALCNMRAISPELMGGLEFFTYYLVDENVPFDALQNKITKPYDKVLNELFSQFNAVGTSFLEPLPQIHLHTICDWDISPKGDMNQIVLISLIAGFVLLIAIINFINLYVHHGEKRLKEIGLRKILGVTPKSLSMLFYSETALITLAALLLAWLIASASLPFFADIIQVKISLNDLFSPITIVLTLIFVILFIAAAGAWPAWYLSQLPITVSIKGGYKTIQRKKWIAVSSVVIQFFISSLLIMSLLVIHLQINFVKNIPLGFQIDHVIAVSNFNQSVDEKAVAIIEELKKLNFVEEAGSSSHFMGGGCSGQAVYKFGESETTARSINEYRVQPGFCKTMGLELLEGRFFSPNEQDRNAIILNEAAVKYLGLDKPLQSALIMFDETPLQIIGVVKDFIYLKNAGHQIQPLLLAAYDSRVSVIYVKTQESLTPEKTEMIAKVFHSFLPDYTFSSALLKDIYQNKLESENRIYLIISSGALLAIILSFVGMFALSVYNVEKRTKEIGIRKVNGSTSWQILVLFLKDILKWVVLAMIPAFLTATIFLQSWLSEFSNHLRLSITNYVVAGIISLLIASLAILVKSVQAARQNPVKSLKYE